ncbi:MAG: glycoside hydrolase family 28 protein, partial [Planctomycetes bacterium]|nr:glycoside hydrolase family 28 protein [Planctomycetota bacterium]
NLKRTVLTLALILSCVCSSPAFADKEGWDLLPEILARIVPPTFPDIDYAITDYGAVGDGVTDCSPAFKKAIAACTKTGGRVVVPKGVWFSSGPIHLDNNVNLHVTKDARVKFGFKLDDYLPPVLTRDGQLAGVYRHSPFIYAYQKTNVAVTGSGTLDGQAELYWVGRKVRPRFIHMYECKNILIEDVTLTDYAGWCVHPAFCTNITVRNIRVISDHSNNDGIDPDSCTDMLIDNCYLNQSDDSIAIKSGKNQAGRQIGIPCQNIIIRNMKVWKGLAIGSECSGGVRNVFMYDCDYKGKQVLYCKSNLDRGGYIEDIYVRNIKVEGARLLRLRNDYHNYTGGNFPTRFRNIHIENVTVKNARENAISVVGVERAPVRNVYLKNITLENASEPITLVQHAENVVLDNVYVNGVLQPTHPKKTIPPTLPYITAISSGYWSDSSIWDVWEPDGVPDGRQPNGADDTRVLIGYGIVVPMGVTVILDKDIDATHEVRVFKNSTLVIPPGRTMKVGLFRPDRPNSAVRQCGGNVISPHLYIDDVTCQYFITGGSIEVGRLNVSEGSFTIDDSGNSIKKIFAKDTFLVGGYTTTKFIAHAEGVTPIECKDVNLKTSDGETLIVDVSNYDYKKNGDLVLFSYTGTRTGKFDGGPENPTPQVTIIGGNAELVYDDAEKKIKLTNFGP